MPAARTPDEEHQPASPDLCSFSPAFTPELEALERRLEASVPDITGLVTDEPCVWFCACFLAHGA